MTSPAPPDTIAVASDPPEDPALRQRARQLALDLDLPGPDDIPPTAPDFQLTVTATRLELRVVGGPPDLRGGRALWIDVAQRDVTSPAGARLRQPLLRAMGVRQRRVLQEQSPRIIDATAGWGRDALMLAALGCRVLAIERHPAVARLLADGVKRARAAGDPTGDRVTVMPGDAGAVLAGLQGPPPAVAPELNEFGHPDAVYLDPMFPPRRGGAAEAKAMRVLRRLVGPDVEATALLVAARRLAPPRIVVKRPTHAPPLGDVPPDASYPGRAMRYDVYFAAGMIGPGD
jgi:16S rRNA (guanine1516-N2)-methyltransferase